MNNIAEQHLSHLDGLILQYHKRCPKAETPLNFIEWLGVEKMIEILECAEKDNAHFKIIFDYSNPHQPKLEDIQYIKNKPTKNKPKNKLKVLLTESIIV